MIALALTTVCLALQLQTHTTHLIIQGIWAVFVLDYAVRLLHAPSRRDFVRSNVLDLVAILPYDLLRATRFLRLLRLLRLVRGFEVLWRVSATARGILRTNRLGQVIGVVGVLILGGGMLITRVEPTIGTFSDGLWWSVVTATTVGYGDIAPKTTEGRLIAAFLMFMGIGTIGMITGSIATYFLGSHGSSNRHVQHLQKELDHWDEMTPHQRHQLVRVLAALAQRPTESQPLSRAPTPEADPVESGR